MQFTCPFILASGSPRRKQLLEQLGLDFTIQVSDADESFDPAWSPPDIAMRIATRKVEAISKLNPDALTLAADTIVVFGNEILNKPETPAEAVSMLSRLSGNKHQVYTGLALAHPKSGRQISAYEETDVYFSDMSSSEIEQYVASGSPMDKAGAYGIQDDRGALFVSRIEGDYYNVVGLPLHRLYKAIKESFSDLLTS